MDNKREDLVADAKPRSDTWARYSLYDLVFNVHRHTKRIYNDGHERKDVVEYRTNEFLPAMLGHQRQMTHYSGPDCNIEDTP
eukprot:CAMPEP_0202082466 /NCGR_PEP_ID=MMETSP0964-20121228/19588_1 /ASSEMBLY_ACC=CAM_ASM_000500 /TAXON_ID=4773 /ORGANISM="Schizochytrium aggregatum, Strain ATCC28209" /LENGTH=81 /DNA_ID=CAMNT_0048650107 /DNA_START=87 /DNA_END=332 /DNA_ORIENTATION=+